MRAAIPVTTILPGATNPRGPVKIGPLAPRRMYAQFAAFPVSGSVPGQALVGVSPRAFRTAAQFFNPGVSGGGAFFIVPADGRTYGPFVLEYRQQLYAAGTIANAVLLSAWIWEEVAPESAGEQATDLAIGETIPEAAPAPSARKPAPDAKPTVVVPAIAAAVAGRAQLVVVRDGKVQPVATQSPGQIGSITQPGGNPLVGGLGRV